MFCPNCGNRIYNSALFCNNCGYKIKQKNSILKSLKGKPVFITAIVILFICIIVFILIFKTGKGLQKNAWVENDNKWYFADDKGKLVKSDWKEVNGEYYYFDISGVMQQDSWINWEGDFYYVDGSGKMLKNVVTPIGVYVDGNGKAIGLE